MSGRRQPANKNIFVDRKIVIYLYFNTFMLMSITRNSIENVKSSLVMQLYKYSTS